jgi:hypothetical protein
MPINIFVKYFISNIKYVCRALKNKQRKKNIWINIQYKFVKQNIFEWKKKLLRMHASQFPLSIVVNNNIKSHYFSQITNSNMSGWFRLEPEMACIGFQ